LVRGLFHRNRTDLSQLVEVREQDQPLLFEFLHRLCEEVKSPFPHRVYLSWDVNAAVFAQTSVLNLFVPAPRNLLVGLGLVNALNLTEFKAVLAHEFGHFSQKSSRLTHYVYMANPIMADIVYRRDAVDRLLSDAWHGMIALGSHDIRVGAFLLLLFLPMVVPLLALQLFRIVLQWLFKAINFQNQSLRREMEFNADLVAASVTGSDAPVHVLHRLQFAAEALAFARDDLASAADHGWHTSNLFVHHARAGDYLRKRLQEPNRGVPPPLPPDPAVAPQLFPIENHDVLAMWASHPPHHAREKNVKRRYFRTTFDERSPWLLFRDSETVCAQVTRNFYRAALNIAMTSPPTDPETVHRVIEAERADDEFAPSYLGAYDDRFISPGDIDALLAIADRAPSAPDQLPATHAALFDQFLSNWMKEHQQRRKDEQVLAAVSLEADFEFRGQRYGPGDARWVRNQVRTELERDDLFWADLDRRVFLLHFQAARLLPGELHRELADRYRFHLTVQRLLLQWVGHCDFIGSALHFLQSTREITADQFRSIVHGSLHAHHALCRGIAEASAAPMPAMRHLRTSKSLGEFVLREQTEKDFFLDEDSLHPARMVPTLTRFNEQFGHLKDRLRRVHFKSLGAILDLQESIWRAASATLSSGLNESADSAASQMPIDRGT
jgi:Zn-dependent protease with chaperone function